MRVYYYASKISSNISETPEGYLICRNVPIARTGSQDYLRRELGLTDSPEDMVTVMRTEEEVFSPATIASFEGKPLTDDHPHEGVDSGNISQYIRGTTTNVRKGTGADSDKLMADIIIYEKYLIDEVKDGKREISCGYDSGIEERSGTFYQVTIRGNHVAVVDAGRAGADVKIKDQKPKTRRNISMAKKMTFADKVARFLGMTQDADPAVVAEVIAEMATDEEKTQDSTETVPAADTEPKTTDSPDLLELVKALTDTVNELKDQMAASTTTDEDPLLAVQKELEQEIADSGGSDPATEEGSTVDPEQIDEESDNPVSDEDPIGDIDPTTDTEAVPTADKRAAVNYIKQMRPLIAAQKDAQLRKKMSDSLLTFARGVKGVKDSGQKNGYQKLADAKAKNLRSQAKKQVVNDAAVMQKNYDNRNPHKKQKEEK